MNSAVPFPINDPATSEITFGNGVPLSKAIQEAATIYHSDQWLDALSHFFRYRIHRESIQIDGTRVALAQFVTIHNLTGRKLRSPPASMYGEVLYQNQSDHHALVSLLQEKAARHREKLIIKSHEKVIPGMHLRSTDIDARIALRDEATNRSALSQNARRCVNKTQRSKLRVESVGSNRINQFFPLLVATRRRLSLPVTPRTWLRKIIDSGLARMILAYDGTTPVAGVLFLSDNHHLHYALPAYSNAGARCGALGACIWYLVRLGIKEGKKWLCLGGSSPENKGLRHYKRKWGAEEREINVFTSVPKMNQNSEVDSGHRLMRWLPTPLLELVGYSYLRYLV